MFRELQRVMTSGSGPINWELARQVGVAGAVETGDDSEPTGQDRAGFEDAVRVAELQVAAATGLEPPSDIAEVRVIRRATWVADGTDGLRGLLEPAAARWAGAVASDGMMAQLAPLLMGAQVGTVLGTLALRVLGQYDVAVPRTGPATVSFVGPNIAALQRDWSLDTTDLRIWVALHEVTHRFEFARPWARERFSSLLDDFLSTLSIDVEGLASQLATMDAADPESLQGLMESEEGLFGAQLDDEQRIKLGRIQAFMAAAEGYGDHVLHTVGGRLLPSYARIDEAMSRIDLTEGDPVFERLLGIEMKREQYAAGRRFCDTVVTQTDEATLARMWESADAMPSLPEIDEPRLWLARTV